jgi:hypothetical protein
VPRNGDFYLCGQLHSCRACGTTWGSGEYPRSTCIWNCSVRSNPPRLAWRRLVTLHIYRKAHRDPVHRSRLRAVESQWRGILNSRVCLNWRKPATFRSDGPAGRESATHARAA